MHIFLTGEIQVGKSTVVNNTLSLLNINYGGFKTYFGKDRNSSNKNLYINSATKSHVFNEENVIAIFKEGCKPLVDVLKFNIYGSELIRAAKDKEDLILMDECGSLESKALEFQREVINALNGFKPVLGVVKLGSKGWTDSIRNHPNVKLITVTKKNRNYLPKILKGYFQKMIHAAPF
jgi:nucleoside-triphosphatase